MTNKLKENWNKVDDKCPQCNSITKRARGITRQNIKILFGKPTLQDMIVFIMLVGCLLLAWAYNRDTAMMRETLEDPTEMCMVYNQNLLNPQGGRVNTGNVPLNITYQNG